MDESFFEDDDLFKNLFKGLDDDPTVVKDIFSPTNFDEYIGQENTKVLLKIAIEAAKKEQRPLPNIMLVGGFGQGKTALAKVVFHEFGLDPKLMDGSFVNTKLPKGPVIIDEIHNLTPNVADSLNILLDSGSVHIIGCTTNVGLLPAAFRSRFRIFNLKNYTVNELVTIAGNICARKGVTANQKILYEIAKRSRFNARQVTMYLSTIFDLMAIENQTIVSESLVKRVFKLLSVDDKGYLDRDREYVQALPEGRPVGIKWLSAVLGIDDETIEQEIEPFLLQQGVIDRTPRGRLKIMEI